MSANEDVGPRREVDCEIPHWLGRRGGLLDPTLVREENESLFIRVWKPLTS